MLELIVMACLTNAPDTCREHNLTLAEPGLNASQCLYSSLPRVALWEQLNQNWKVRSWRCTVISDQEAA